MEPTFPVKFPVWIYEPPADGSFPFIGAVKLPSGAVKLEPFPTRKQAFDFTERVVLDLLVPPKDKR